MIQNSVRISWTFAIIMTLIRSYAVWEKITYLHKANYDDFNRFVLKT